MELSFIGQGKSSKKKILKVNEKLHKRSGINLYKVR